MSLQGVLPFVVEFFSPKKRIEIEVSQAQLTGDAGLLPHSNPLGNRPIPIRVFIRCVCAMARIRLNSCQLSGQMFLAAFVPRIGWMPARRRSLAREPPCVRLR